MLHRNTAHEGVARASDPRLRGDDRFKCQFNCTFSVSSTTRSKESPAPAVGHHKAPPCHQAFGLWRFAQFIWQLRIGNGIQFNPVVANVTQEIATPRHNFLGFAALGIIFGIVEFDRRGRGRLLAHFLAHSSCID